MAAQSKHTKKRPAPSQAGPASKKPNLEKPLKPSFQSQPVHKKRARPVVQARDPDTGTDDSDAEEERLMEEEEELDDKGSGGEGGDLDDDDVEMETGEKLAKDPNAARESHKAQKVLHAERRAAKPHSDLLTNAKIQTVVKWGVQKQRDQIAVELKGRYKELAQNKYSKFLVIKIIRLCPAHRVSILLEFQSNVIRLLLHREASRAIADTFELYANAYERAILLRDFYGKETALFAKSTGRESEAEKEKLRKGLRGVLEGVDVERRKRVLGELKENLVNIFNNPEKGSIRHAIVHRALLEYLMEINELQDEDEREKLRKEMFESCQDIFAEMVHTKEGSRVVREFLAQGTAKDRKTIVKTIKPYIETMANDDEAQLVLFTALDVIDDTKMVAKTLLPSLTAHTSTLHKTSQGRRALLYPLVPRTRRHFTPATIASLAETDTARGRTSKKDADARVAEVRAAASPELLAWVAKDGAEVYKETGGSLVVLEVMLEGEGYKSSAMETLLRPLASPYPSSDASTLHPLDLPHTSRLIKTLLQGGHFSHATRAVERAPRFSSKAFAEMFMRVVGRDATLAMARGPGAFVVAELLERVKAEGSDDAREELKNWVSDIDGEASGDGVRGWGVLMDKVRALKS
ncbi:hypothetical protein EW146_g8387 [Bondarzewia mesenterica]|uniref:CPL domain-containing protein n=1 Tax=Bondarzewia mesenterica TaxID=1095465 RepID=A0A4S4LFC5_9AGAM|nr:hypothetical protein EW146_g8387 [Bondarzewia mesenterica]